MCHCLHTRVLHLAIHLAEHNILSTNDGHNVGNHVPTDHRVKSGEMRKARRTDLAAVGLGCAIRHEVHTKLALRSLDRRVRSSCGNGISLRVELEVVDECLHRVLHFGPSRGGDLVVVNTDLALGHIVQALVDNAQRLPHLLTADQIAVVAVAVAADRNIKLHAVVHIVGLRLADVPGDTRCAQHGATEAPVHCLLCGHNTNIDETLLPDAVACEKFFSFVNARAELLNKLVNVLHEADGHVQGDAARPHIRRMHACARHALVKLHHLLAFLKQPEERCESTNVECVGGDGHNVVENPGNLGKQDTNVLSTKGDLDIQQLLHRK
eukprot:Opistho-2@25945